MGTELIVYREDNMKGVILALFLVTEYFAALSVQLAFASRTGLLQGKETDLACVPFPFPVQLLLTYVMAAVSEAAFRASLARVKGNMSSERKELLVGSGILLVVIYSACVLFVYIFLVC